MSQDILQTKGKRKEVINCLHLKANIQIEDFTYIEKTLSSVTETEHIFYFS